MRIWIARDFDGSLFLYREKPINNGSRTFVAQTSQWWRINKENYPEVTFENSPKRLQLNLMEE